MRGSILRPYQPVEWYSSGRTVIASSASTGASLAATTIIPMTMRALRVSGSSVEVMSPMQAAWWLIVNMRVPRRRPSWYAGDICRVCSNSWLR